MSKPFVNNFKLKIDGVPITANSITVSARSSDIWHATVDFITTISVAQSINTCQMLCVETLHEKPNTATELRNLVTYSELVFPSLCRCVISGNVVSLKIIEDAPEINRKARDRDNYSDDEWDTLCEIMDDLPLAFYGYDQKESFEDAVLRMAEIIKKNRSAPNLETSTVRNESTITFGEWTIVYGRGKISLKSQIGEPRIFVESSDFIAFFEDHLSVFNDVVHQISDMAFNGRTEN